MRGNASNMSFRAASGFLTEFSNTDYNYVGGGEAEDGNNESSVAEIEGQTMRERGPQNNSIASSSRIEPADNRV